MFTTTTVSRPTHHMAPRRPGSRRSGYEPLRPVPDPFDIGETPGPGLHSVAAERIAESISSTLGEHHPEIDEYVALLGYAPAVHLSGLVRRGARIFFAPTVAHYLVSAAAEDRRLERGHPPSDPSENPAIDAEYGARSGVLAAYDPETDALVLPYLLGGPDKLRAVLHEIGHAVTYHQLHGHEHEYAHVLSAPPQRIREHLLAGYEPAISVRVKEAFAEAYAMLAVGRTGELGAIASDLVGILSRVDDPEKKLAHPAWKMDPESGRSATLADPAAVPALGPIPELHEPLPVQPTSHARDAARSRAA